MKITLYKSVWDHEDEGQYGYTEHIGKNHYFHQLSNFSICPEFDCPVSEIGPDHPFAYGWLENLAQGKNRHFFYHMEFKKIKFER